MLMLVNDYKIVQSVEFIGKQWRACCVTICEEIWQTIE